MAVMRSRLRRHAHRSLTALFTAPGHNPLYGSHVLHRAPLACVHPDLSSLYVAVTQGFGCSNSLSPGSASEVRDHHLVQQRPQWT